MCRLTVVWVDCRCSLSLVFLGGARRLELSPCNTQPNHGSSHIKKVTTHMPHVYKAEFGSGAWQWVSIAWVNPLHRFEVLHLKQPLHDVQELRWQVICCCIPSATKSPPRRTRTKHLMTASSPAIAYLLLQSWYLTWLPCHPASSPCTSNTQFPYQGQDRQPLPCQTPRRMRPTDGLVSQPVLLV